MDTIVVKWVLGVLKLIPLFVILKMLDKLLVIAAFNES
jgi:hypothetical protein